MCSAVQLTSFQLHSIRTAESPNASHGNDDQPSPRERIIYPDPEVERDIYVEPRQFSGESLAAAHARPAGYEEEELMQMINSLRNAGHGSNLDGNAAGFATFNNFGSFGGANGGDMPNDPLLAGLFGAQGAQTPVMPETGLRKFLNSKIHIAVLSIFTYTLINMAPFACNVFLIFLLWEIVEIFILRQHQTNANGFANVVFMMAGVSPTKINVFFKWIQLANKVLRDIAIFLFFFVSSHIIFLTIVGRKLVADESIATTESHSFGDIVEPLLDNEFDDPFDLK